MPITRIVVAHRPALIARAHRVYVVGGRTLTTLGELRPGPSEALAAPAEPARLTAAQSAGHETAR
jgi:ABC-type bacteriocin/lantibiotic exporter with double-glycine peptidase domain